MFAVLSHAMERANQVIDRLPGFPEYKFAIDRSFECAELKAEAAALRERAEKAEADLTAALANCEEQRGWQGRRRLSGQRPIWPCHRSDETHDSIVDVLSHALERANE